jgi:hypothetical protein
MIKKALLIGILITSLFGGIYLVKKTQETRRGAAAGVNLSFDKSSYAVNNSGDIVTTRLIADSGQRKVDLVSLNLSYDSGLQIQNISLGALPNQMNVTSGGGQIEITAVKTGNWQQLPSGSFTVATITVKVNSAGSLRFNSATVNGCNPSGSDCPVTSHSTSTRGADFEIRQQPVATNTPTSIPTNPPQPEITAYFEPDDYQVSQSGDTVKANLMIDSSQKKVDIASLRLNYSSSLEIVDVNLVGLPSELDVDYGGGLLVIQANKSSPWEQLPWGVFTVAEVEVRINGQGNLTFTNAEASGCIPVQAAGSCEVTEYQVNTSGAIFELNEITPTVTPEPTSTTIPTETPQPTDTPQPTNTDTPPQPTNTEGPSGCKPCPDGGYVGSVADYNCDGTINMEDFAGWYDDYKLNSNYLYGDFNCNGQLDEGDVNQWYSELPKF